MLVSLPQRSGILSRDLVGQGRQPLVVSVERKSISMSPQCRCQPLSLLICQLDSHQAYLFHETSFFFSMRTEYRKKIALLWVYCPEAIIFSPLLFHIGQLSCMLVLNQYKIKDGLNKLHSVNKAQKILCS